MSHRILLITSNPSLQEEFTKIVKQEGYQIFTLNHVEKVGKFLKVDPHFDLIFLEVETMTDHIVSELEGLKQDPRTSIIPVILFLHEENVLDQLTVLESGADDYVLVPFQPIPLQLRLRILSNLIETRKKMVQLEYQIQMKKELEKMVTTISHYINNALVPLLHMEFQTETLRMNATNRIYFIRDLLSLLQKISLEMQTDTIDSGVYSGLLINIEEEVNQLKSKYGIN